MRCSSGSAILSWPARRKPQSIGGTDGMIRRERRCCTGSTSRSQLNATWNIDEFRNKLVHEQFSPSAKRLPASALTALSASLPLGLNASCRSTSWEVPGEPYCHGNVPSLKRGLMGSGRRANRASGCCKQSSGCVSAKILRDKQVRSFEDLDLNDVEDVFQRVGKHYGTKPLVAGSKKRLEALSEAADVVNQFSSLVLTTTEALAYVYETYLISKETSVGLGTHSTPSFLVDYVVGTWLNGSRRFQSTKEACSNQSCGHAAFLVVRDASAG